MNSKRPLALLLALLAVSAAAPAQTYLVNRVVLRINDRIATLQQFQTALAERRAAISESTEIDDQRREVLLSAAGRRVLADLYEEMLLQSRADQLALRVSEAELDQAVAQTRSRMGLQDDAEFRRALATAGLDEESLRTRLRNSQLVQQVLSREVQSRVEVDEEELRRFWREHAEEFTVPEAVRLQDVVVYSEGRPPGEATATARQVHAELAAGADMVEVARRWSAEGKTTSEVDLGWVERGDLDPTLERAAWTLAVGDVTQPIPGRGGLHILRLLERREASVRPFEDVKQAIESRERQRRMGEVYLDYLKELEERSYIVMNVPPEAEGFRGLAEGQDELADAPQPALEEAAEAAAAASAAAAEAAADETEQSPPPAAPPSSPDGGR
jgi:parvulin-like peptidyl-prolyl isomerase